MALDVTQPVRIRDPGHFVLVDHEPNVARGSSCPLWAISGHFAVQLSCPLYPRKRTGAVQLRMSALGQKRTFGRLFDRLVGPIADIGLLDHLVSER
jgi:hypothetical protein